MDTTTVTEHTYPASIARKRLDTYLMHEIESLELSIALTNMGTKIGKSNATYTLTLEKIALNHILDEIRAIEEQSLLTYLKSKKYEMPYSVILKNALGVEIYDLL